MARKNARSAVTPPAPIVEALRQGLDLLRLRTEFGPKGYLEEAWSEERFGRLSSRTAQNLIAFAEACRRCEIRESDLAAFPELRIGSVRSRTKQLQPPKKDALRLLRSWQGQTAREASHKSRRGSHASFDDLVAAVVRQTSGTWSVAFAVERGKHNFDWQVLTGLAESEARALLVGVAWTARAARIQVLGIATWKAWTKSLRLPDVETDAIAIAPGDAGATPGGALAALGSRSGSPTLERVCEVAGWPVPAAGEMRRRDEDVRSAICLLATARGARRR